MGLMKNILRPILGGVLGIFIGENPIATGLIGTSLFLPMLVFYIFLFLTLDWLIVRFKLSDRSFIILNAILAILIGGILDREFFTPSPEMGIFGLEPLTVILVTLWWGASFILIFHLVNAIIPREKVIFGAFGGGIFLFLTAVMLGPALPVILTTVNPLGLLLLLVAITGLFAWFLRLIKSPSSDNRPVLQKNWLIAAISLVFVVLATIFGLQGYIILSGTVVLIVLLLMTRYRISI